MTCIRINYWRAVEEDRRDDEDAKDEELYKILGVSLRRKFNCLVNVL